MNCPKCGAATEEVDVRSIRVDRCPECGGTWYDRGELRLLKDKESGGDYCWVDVDLWKDAEKVSVDETSRGTCPRDGAPMAAVRYGESGIVVETCPKCSGIWLDAGEYDKIISHLGRTVDAETSGQLLADVREEFAEVFTGDEGVQSELHDLGRVLYLLQLRFVVEHPALGTIKEAVRNMFPW